LQSSKDGLAPGVGTLAPNEPGNIVRGTGSRLRSLADFVMLQSQLKAPQLVGPSPQPLPPASQQSGDAWSRPATPGPQSKDCQAHLYPRANVVAGRFAAKYSERSGDAATSQQLAPLQMAAELMAKIQAKAAGLMRQGTCASLTNSGGGDAASGASGAHATSSSTAGRAQSCAGSVLEDALKLLGVLGQGSSGTVFAGG
jgi:hypothetical protein